jgi:hypothetical protein
LHRERGGPDYESLGWASRFCVVDLS